MHGRAPKEARTKLKAWKVFTAWDLHHIQYQHAPVELWQGCGRHGEHILLQGNSHHDLCRSLFIPGPLSTQHLPQQHPKCKHVCGLQAAQRTPLDHSSAAATYSFPSDRHNLPGCFPAVGAILLACDSHMKHAVFRAEEWQRTLLMMPWLRTSGGMCVTVPVVFVSTRLTTSMSRASPKSDTFAQNPCGLVAHDVSRTLPATQSTPFQATPQHTTAIVPATAGENRSFAPSPVVERRDLCNTNFALYNEHSRHTSCVAQRYWDQSHEGAA